MDREHQPCTKECCFDPVINNVAETILNRSTEYFKREQDLLKTLNFLQQLFDDGNLNSGIIPKLASPTFKEFINLKFPWHYALVNKNSYRQQQGLQYPNMNGITITTLEEVFGYIFNQSYTLDQLPSELIYNINLANPYATLPLSNGNYNRQNIGNRILLSQYTKVLPPNIQNTNQMLSQPNYNTFIPQDQFGILPYNTQFNHNLPRLQQQQQQQQQIYSLYNPETHCHSSPPNNNNKIFGYGIKEIEDILSQLSTIIQEKNFEYESNYSKIYPCTASSIFEYGLKKKIQIIQSTIKFYWDYDIELPIRNFASLLVLSNKQRQEQNLKSKPFIKYCGRYFPKDCGVLVKYYIQYIFASLYKNEETGFKALDISNYKANHNTNVNNDDGDLDDKTEDIFSSATNCIKDQKALGLFVDKLCYLLSSKRNYDINKNVVRAALTITEFIARVLSQMLKGTIALDGGSQNIGNSITDFTKWIWHFVDLNEETNHFVHYQPISWFLNEIYGL